MATFFIDRPIFAWVLAILLCLTGTIPRSRATECASDR